MGSIKIYLEFAEHDAVRTAEEEIDRDIIEKRDGRQHSRSPFGDSAGPVPLHEGKAEPSHWR